MKISSKLILITFIILIGVTTAIIMLTTKRLDTSVRSREENINLDYAAARATAVEKVLTDLVHRTRSAAGSLMRAANDPKIIPEDFQDGFMHDASFYAIEIQKADGGILDHRVKDKDICKCDQALITKAHMTSNFPIDKVREGQIVVQNTTIEGGPSMFTIGIPLAKDENGKITHIALADIDLGLIEKPFSVASERTFYAVDDRGILLAHSDERRVLARQDFSNAEIVGVARTAKFARGRHEVVVDPRAHKRVDAAYAKTAFNITVFSEIPSEIIQEPVNEVKKNVLFVAGISLSAAFFIIFLFSMSLTAPIEKLVELTETVSKGNFNVKASASVTSEDEVGQLARAFDHMTEGLKERDKVKSLFTKFHGSSITEDLMTRKTTLEGESKDVLVFFSDIRGFTAFAEKRDPKEVFVMLNEYFKEMVSIVNTHGGVVDKFIGDAIMAVWGAPKATENDAHNAVMACLKMRQALNELNERRLARGQTPLLIGMGLHAGTAISGIIGSNERMEYTVIGNTVNTTSRVEAATKTFGSDLLITEEVVARIGGDFKVETAGAAEVKGRSDALKLYKVLGYMDKQTNGFVEIRTPYSEYPIEEDAKVSVVGSEEAA